MVLLLPPPPQKQYLESGRRFSIHPVVNKVYFLGIFCVHRWILRHSVTVSLIYDVGAAAGFVHMREAKAVCSD